MSKEIEATFVEVDHDKLRKVLKSTGAELVYPSFLMQRSVWDFPDFRLDKKAAWVRVRRPEDQTTFEGWTAARFGWRLYRIFFKTYTEKVWGMPCNEMSADWAAQRIKGLSLWGAVLDGLKRSLGLNKRPNDGQAVKTLLETFRYPRLGPGMMWDAARDKIVAILRQEGVALLDKGM